MKEKMLKEDFYAIISPGNTEGYGGVLFTPFYDDKLVEMWLQLSELSRDNLMVYHVIENTYEEDMSHDFIKDSLNTFIERHEDMCKEDWYENEELFYELKEHCKKILGKDFFKKQ